jgi:hypothetical protein
LTLADIKDIMNRKPVNEGTMHSLMVKDQHTDVVQEESNS